MRIVLVGLGWLGEPLAASLMAAGYSLCGTVRSADKAQRLSAEGYCVQEWVAEKTEPLPFDLLDCCLVITLPPSSVPDYVDTLRRLVLQARQQQCRQIVMVSSTAVYSDDDSGCELSPPSPDSARGTLLLQAEAVVKTDDVPWLVFRAVGLIGPGRHPSRFLSGKRTARGGARVNLVHLDDVVRFLLVGITQRCGGQTFNLCSPDHPSRQDFYSRACQRAGVALPEFTDDSRGGKQIDGQRVVKVLGETYHVSDWMHWLESAPI